jgi:hypothetical protein
MDDSVVSIPVVLPISRVIVGHNGRQFQFDLRKVNSDSVMFPAIDVALPAPVMLPIEIKLPMFMVMFSWFAANATAIGDAIPTTRETAATILTTAIKFNLYMHLQ